MVRVAIGESSGQAPIRQTTESLLRAQRRAVEAIAAERRETERRMERVAEQVRHATKLPQGRAAADNINALAERTGPVFAAAARDTSAAFAHEVHALLDLLAVNHHDRGPLPPLDTAVIGPDGITAAFPEGYARDYIATVMDELGAGGMTSKVEADVHPTLTEGDITASRTQVVDQTSQGNRRQVEELMNHPDSHAVELHGPHVTAKELELRAGWTRPPNRGIQGADKWRHRSDTDGRVKSQHRVSHEAAAFTTPEAFARPLDTFLDVANRHPGGLDGFLDQHAYDGRASFFVTAEQARLSPGDAHGYRGAGTGTREAAKDWGAMRTDAMRADIECQDPVRTIAYDPVADCADPGVRLIFTDRGNGWALTTYYPAGEPGPDNIRLEDIR